MQWNRAGFVFRGKAAIIHTLASVFLLAIPLVLLTYWAYPGALFWGDGGGQLIKIAVCVDLCMGPLLTFLAFGPKKKLKLRIIDLCVIVVLQLIAFGYGFHAMWEQRPAGIVYADHALRSISRYQVRGTPPAETKELMGVMGAPLLRYEFPSTKLADLEKFLNAAQAEDGVYINKSDRWFPMQTIEAKEVQQMKNNDLLLSRVKDPKQRATIQKWLDALPAEKKDQVHLYALVMRYKNQIVALDFDTKKIVKVFDVDPGPVLTL